MTAEENIRLTANESYSASVSVTDSDNDPLTYLWEIKSESNADQEGGDAEKIPETIPNKIDDPSLSTIKVTAPSASGAYRLFVYAYDGNGHAAHANIPFYVK